MLAKETCSHFFNSLLRDVHIETVVGDEQKQGKTTFVLYWNILTKFLSIKKRWQNRKIHCRSTKKNYRRRISLPKLSISPAWIIN
jgi:hypothetical protein